MEMAVKPHPQYVEQEVVKRQQLKGIVASLLKRIYQLDPGSRVKRGPVHIRVAERLGIVHNNVLSDIIKSALSDLGAQPSCSRGIQYYRGLRERN